MFFPPPPNHFPTLYFTLTAIIKPVLSHILVLLLLQESWTKGQADPGSATNLREDCLWDKSQPIHLQHFLQQPLPGIWVSPAVCCASCQPRASSVGTRNFTCFFWLYSTRFHLNQVPPTNPQLSVATVFWLKRRCKRRFKHFQLLPHCVLSLNAIELFLVLCITGALPKSLGFIFGKGNVEIKVSYTAEHLYYWAA